MRATKRYFRDFDPDDESGFETGEYWARRDAAVEARIAADTAFAATPQGRREALQRKLDAMRFARHDHGAYSDAELAAVEAELDALTGPNGAQVVTEHRARTVCEQLAQRAYEAGRHAAIMELHTSDDAAAAVNRSAPWVRAAAAKHSIGWRVGRDWVFVAADIERLHAIASAAKPGRPRTAR